MCLTASSGFCSTLIQEGNSKPGDDEGDEGADDEEGERLQKRFKSANQLGRKRSPRRYGAGILYFQCFVTTDMFLFCKPIIFSGNCRICRDLAFGSGKTRFEAILKKLDFSTQIYFLQLFGEICRPKMPKVSKVKK